MMNYLISIQKDEHSYIKEWYNHHKKFGFDKIVVFNNSPISYNITDPSYQEIDVSKMEAPQPYCYQYFYDKVMKLGDTATILDGDEFLFIPTNIDSFVSTYMKDCDCLRLSWQTIGDCGNVKYEDKPVLERFKDIPPIDCVFNRDLPNGITENFHTKYIVRKTWKTTFLSIHNPIIQFGISKNVNGEIVNGDSPFMKPTWDIAYIKHMLTKSTEEFAKRRLNKKDACGNVVASNDKLIERYFRLNGYSKETEDFFKDYLKRNTEN